MIKFKTTSFMATPSSRFGQGSLTYQWRFGSISITPFKSSTQIFLWWRTL